MNDLIALDNAPKHLQSYAEIPASENPAIVYLSSFKSTRSPRVMQNALRNIVTIVLGCAPQDLAPDAELYFAWHELRYQHAQAISAKLVNMYKPATVNRHMSALRGVLKECWLLRYMDVDTYKRAAAVKNIKYSVLPAGRDVPDKEMRQLLLQCYEDGNKGVRDLAILAVLVTTGMRREELAQLDLKDLDLETGGLHVRGKGHKDRTVYVMNKAADCLHDWLTIRSDEKGALFTSVNKGGKVSLKRLPATAIHTMITQRAKRAGLKKVTPHDFRRTFVGNMLDENVDAVTITKLTGHADMKMLQRYDRRDERVKKDATSKLDLPI